MKAERKTTKQTSRGKSKTQKVSLTHKAVAPKPHEKKTVRKNEQTTQLQIENILEGSATAL